jgi:hypothetical protein
MLKGFRKVTDCIFRVGKAKITNGMLRGGQAKVTECMLTAAVLGSGCMLKIRSLREQTVC